MKPAMTAAERREYEAIEREVREESARYWKAQQDAKEAESAEFMREAVEKWRQQMLTPEIVLGLAEIERVCATVTNPAVAAALRWIVVHRDAQAQSDQGWLQTIASWRGVWR